MSDDDMATRVFCYVDDRVEGITWLLATGEGLIGLGKIGSPHETPMKEPAEQMPGSKPPMHLKDGLRRTVKYFEDTLRELA